MAREHLSSLGKYPPVCRIRSLASESARSTTSVRASSRFRRAWCSCGTPCFVHIAAASDACGSGGTVFAKYFATTFLRMPSGGMASAVHVSCSACLVTAPVVFRNANISSWSSKQRPPCCTGPQKWPASSEAPTGGVMSSFSRALFMESSSSCFNSASLRGMKSVMTACMAASAWSASKTMPCTITLTAITFENDAAPPCTT
mmetsp:Transcript_129476/g.347261  ORF Transcript_129476/g.347261 Transcript_129476/m.347261 type:complete len:202 (+) Transcript_129476:64-669(+)